MKALFPLSFFVAFNLFLLSTCYFFLQPPVLAQFNRVQLNHPLKPCWQYSEEIASPLQILDSTAFFSLSDGTIEALDTTTGKMIWRSQYGGALIIPPTLVNGKLLVAHKTSGDKPGNKENDSQEIFLRLLSPTTGLTLWQKSLNFDPNLSRFFVFFGNSASNSSSIILISDKSITALDKNNFSVLWTRNFSSSFSSFLFAEDSIFVASGNKLSAISTQTGTVLSQIQHDNSIVGKMNFLNGTIYFGDEAGKIFAYDTRKRKMLWKAITGASAVSIKAFERKVLVSSNDNFVYLLSAQNGDKVWKRRFPTKPINDLLVYEKFVIIETLDENKIYILSLETGEIKNQIELDSTPIVSPVVTPNFLLIPTAKGLKAFANSCS
jgi:outer membrane protein assembly factor BamB